MRKLVNVIAITGMLVVAACNTVAGVGRDVSSAGDTLANTADSAK